jgi:hypothetical protein
MANRTATLYIRITTADGKRRYCKAAYQSKGRLKPQYAMVNGEPESEYTTLESVAWWKGTALADWVRDVLLHNLEGSSQAQMEMHIFTELAGTCRGILFFVAKPL